MQLGLAFAPTRPALDVDALCDADERAVARALRWGAGCARQVEAIAAEAEVPPRRTQQIVQHLLLVHRWPIGTSMAEPFGNYLIDAADELEHTFRLLRTRGISNLARAAALKRMSLAELIRHVQVELELGGGDA